jgi:hypothetical protein
MPIVYKILYRMAHDCLFLTSAKHAFVFLLIEFFILLQTSKTHFVEKIC